jgi:hypothetical protein
MGGGMTTTLRAALLRLIVNAGSYGKMAEVYRSLYTEQLTWCERESLFNALVHHRAMTEDAT